MKPKTEKMRKVLEDILAEVKNTDEAMYKKIEFDKKAALSARKLLKKKKKTK